MGGYKKGLTQETLGKAYSIPFLPFPCAFANPANSLQLLRGDPVVTLLAASPCTFKVPGVEQYTTSHPELLNIQIFTKTKGERSICWEAKQK